MFPAGINLLTLETYDAPKEVEEHIFEGSLIEQNKRCVLDIPAFYIVPDILRIQMYLCAI